MAAPKIAFWTTIIGGDGYACIACNNQPFLSATPSGREGNHASTFIVAGEFAPDARHRPVALFPATRQADTVRFNLINPETNNRIRMQTIDAGNSHAGKPRGSGQRLGDLIVDGGDLYGDGVKYCGELGDRSAGRWNCSLQPCA